MHSLLCLFSLHSRSIDSWFDVRVEKALDSGVTITRGILTEQQQQIEVQAQHMASLLTNTPVSMILPELLKQLENRPNQEALVFLSNGTAVAAAGSRINVLMLICRPLHSFRPLKTQASTA